MSLKNIDLKKSYDSEKDKLLQDFYIPVLKNSSEYYRIAGFFSSTALATAAEGIAHFIFNKGKYYLICGVEVSESDYKAFKQGKLLDKQILLNTKALDLQEIENQLILDHLKVLAWLIASDLLIIKLAIIPSEKTGLFHEKIGIFRDEEGNSVSFSGSVNETASGWLNNIEEFKVFRGWIEGEKEYLQLDELKFKSYWENNAKSFKVVELPDAIKNKLLNIRPDKEEFEEIILNLKKSEKSKKKVLRDYQIDAIKNWELNNYRGILEMATGTGKTLTALGAVNRISNKLGKYCVIIVTPYKHLVSQWLEDIKSELTFDVLIEAHSDSNGWKNKLKNYLADYEDNFINKMVIITTYRTLSSDLFCELYKSIKNEGYILIADEVHNIGAPENSKGMLEKISMRLGLSATPSRWFDEAGTVNLLKYFDKSVYTYNLAQAIKDERLTPYDYFPNFIFLNEEEFEKYIELSKKISKNIYRYGDDSKYLQMLLLIRSKIVKNCTSKVLAFKALIENLLNTKTLDHLLVYCDSSEQLESAQKILNDLGVINHKFTQSETLEERKLLLQNFDNGIYKCLVAMKCLDEGVNVPSTETAIILASSSNPREYVQRRGRVLRRYPGKEKATIHDFIVLPPESIKNSELLKFEKIILKKELNRTQEFLETALNKGEILSKLTDIMLTYNVYLD